MVMLARKDAPNEGGEVVAASSRDEEHARDGLHTPLLLVIAEHVISARMPVCIADAAAHPLTRARVRDPDAAPGGSGANLAFAFVPLLDRDGDVLGALGVAAEHGRSWTLDDLRALRDFGSRVRAQADLRVARRALSAHDAFLRALLAQDAAPLMLVDASSHIVSTRVRFDAMLGFTPGELGGRPLRSILHPGVVERGLRTRARLLASRTMQEALDTCYLAKGGALVRARILLCIVRDTLDGRPFTPTWVENHAMNGAPLAGDG